MSSRDAAARQVRSAGPLLRQVEAHMRAEGGPPGAWYVGVAARPGPRLFGVHGVVEDEDWWIWEDAESALVARAVARYFHEQGCQGGFAWDEAATCVYAFRTGGHTSP